MPVRSITCPACGKFNEIEDANLACRRCSTDLEPLLSLDAAAAGLRLLGARALRQQQPEEALALAGQAWGLSPSRATAQVAILASVGCRDWEGLMCWRQRLAALSGA
ncbi:hypothetical protein [Verrucomicrobium sp. BvORR106]|uniref:hypothetical protein n=1 Tax=Verrucomicrobium sp. BvORR106 TaxID=1403819 RepID=UPI000571887E|nr:hypothetical protein [Verrucomicrobium sp. BvORR106]